MISLKFLKDKMWWLNIPVILMWSCFKNQPRRSFLISWCITLWLRVWHLRGKWYEVWRVWEKVWLFQVRLLFGNLQEDIQVDVFCAVYLGNSLFSWIIFNLGQIVSLIFVNTLLCLTFVARAVIKHLHASLMGSDILYHLFKTGLGESICVPPTSFNEFFLKF